MKRKALITLILGTALAIAPTVRRGCPLRRWRRWRRKRLAAVP